MDRFRQGRNWGRDTTRLHHHHGMPMGRLELVRHLVCMARLLPPGAWAVLARALGRRDGRALLAEWIWSFGWSAGKLQLILQKPGMAQAKGPVAAATAAAAKAAAADQVALG